MSYKKTPPTGTLLIIYKSTQRNSTESPLLQLHLEIREQIGPWSLEEACFIEFLKPQSYTIVRQGKYLLLKLSQSGLPSAALSKGFNNLWQLFYPQMLPIATKVLSLIVTSIPISLAIQSLTRLICAPSLTVRMRQAFMNRYAKPYLQLLRTCRQIYFEAGHVLWTTNTFSFNNPKVLRKSTDKL